MEDGKMSVKDALIATREVLGSISVPMVLKKQIADKIDVAIENISVCINAIEKAEQGAENENANAE